MRRAKAQLADDGWMVSEMGTAVFADDRAIVRAYALMDRKEDAAERKVLARHKVRLLFDAGGKMTAEEAEPGGLLAAGAAIGSIEGIHGEECAYTSAEEISRYIVAWMRGHAGIALAGGKPYFVPVDYDDLARLEKALAVVGWTMGNVLVPREKASVTAILDGATADLLSQVDRTISDVESALDDMAKVDADGNPLVDRKRRLRTLLENTKAIDALTGKYQDLLGKSLDAVTERIQQVNLMLVAVGVQA